VLVRSVVQGVIGKPTFDGDAVLHHCALLRHCVLLRRRSSGPPPMSSRSAEAH
jgi:hypothetical protein